MGEQSLGHFSRPRHQDLTYKITFPNAFRAEVMRNNSGELQEVNIFALDPNCCQPKAALHIWWVNTLIVRPPAAK
jgi:hypothetical protein